MKQEAWCSSTGRKTGLHDGTTDVEQGERFAWMNERVGDVLSRSTRGPCTSQAVKLGMEKEPWILPPSMD